MIAVVVLACSLTAGCGFRTGDRVLIPDGYVGWVRIFYREAEAPPLRKEGGKYLIVIDKLGRARTSSALPIGYGSDEYFYVSADGSKTALKQEGVERQKDDMIHHLTFTTTSTGRVFETFFVGPRKVAESEPAPEIP